MQHVCLLCLWVHFALCAYTLSHYELHLSVHAVQRMSTAASKYKQMYKSPYVLTYVSRQTFSSTSSVYNVCCVF